MKAIQIKTSAKTTVSFSTDATAPETYLIGTFGGENGGKTWFGLSGKEVVGAVPLEYKSYKTIEKARLDGKIIATPDDPEMIIVNPRMERAMTSDTSDEGVKKVKAFYQERTNRVMETCYGLLDNDDIGTLMIDTFGQFCKWMEFACEGPGGKYLVIGEKVFMDKSQSRQEIIDFLSSLTPFGKPVILTHRHKDEYVRTPTNKNGKASGRKTWDGFNYLGNHTNIIVEHVKNVNWDPDDDDEAWQFGMNIRECQERPELLGPAGQMEQSGLQDEMIGLAQLIMLVNPNVDAARYM